MRSREQWKSDGKPTTKTAGGKNISNNVNMAALQSNPKSIQPTQQYEL